MVAIGRRSQAIPLVEFADFGLLGLGNRLGSKAWDWGFVLGVSAMGLRVRELDK